MISAADQIGCVRQATNSGALEASSDVLLIAGGLSVAELEAVLWRTYPLLRDGGVLVVQLALPYSPPSHGADS